MKVIDLAKRNPKLIAVVIASLIVVIALVFLVIDSLKNVTVSIVVLPYDQATVIIDGKRFKSGSYRFFPKDSAEVSIEAPNFTTKTSTIKLEKNTIVTIYDYLLNETTGIDYYRTNATDYDLLKIFAKDDEVKEYIYTASKILRLKDALPISYTVMYDRAQQKATNLPFHSTIIQDASDNEQCQSALCISISDNLGEIETAKKLLENRGFKYEDYEVITVDE